MSTRKDYTVSVWYLVNERVKCGALMDTAPLKLKLPLKLCLEGRYGILLDL